MFYLQVIANSQYRKLAMKPNTFVVSNMKYKIRKFLFIHHNLEGVAGRCSVKKLFLEI